MQTSQFETEKEKVMAYFSNGSEGFDFDIECSNCLLCNKQCPIFMVQTTYNYDACNIPVARAILDELIKQDKDGRYIGCQMKPLIEQLFKEKEYPNQGKLFE